MKHVKQRESNIELLRIISMLIIIVYHFVLHSIAPNSPDFEYIIKPLKTVLHIGVICFILISGYWGIKFSLKGFLKLFLYCSFYSLILFVLTTIAKPELFSFHALFKSFIPIQWWFIPVYLCLFLLAPIINIPLENKSWQTKLLFIIVLVLISFVSGQFIPSLSDGKNPVNFILIYYLGNFIRTELKLPERFNTSRLLFIFLLINSLIFVSILVTTLYKPFLSKILYQAFFPYNSIGLIINACLFFLIFTRLTITSKWINWLSGSTLAVYLLHENGYLGHFLYKFITYLQNSIDNTAILISCMLLAGISVFIIGAIIDKLISPIFELLIKPIINLDIILKIDKQIKNMLDFKTNDSVVYTKQAK